MANFVVTHRKRKRDGFTFVSGDLRTLMTQARKAAGGKDIRLVGGAILNGAFHDAGLIDRTVITTVPVVLGDGIPIIEGGRRLRKVRLVARRSWKDGVVQTTYETRR
jgi:dihydrofolate reductase